MFELIKQLFQQINLCASPNIATYAIHVGHFHYFRPLYLSYLMKMVLHSLIFVSVEIII